MKIQRKRFVATALCLILLVGLIVPQLPVVNAVDVSNTVPQQHYSNYSDLALIYDQNSCYSMQGMTVNNTYVYCAKTGSNDARAIVVRIDKNTGAKTLMTNSATGYSYFTNLGHANALDIVTVNGKVFPLLGGQLIWLPPNYVHRYEFRDCEVLCAGFSNDFVPLYALTAGQRKLVSQPVAMEGLYPVLDTLDLQDSGDRLLITELNLHELRLQADSSDFKLVMALPAVE